MRHLVFLLACLPVLARADDPEPAATRPASTRPARNRPPGRFLGPVMSADLPLKGTITKIEENAITLDVTPNELPRDDTPAPKPESRTLNVDARTEIKISQVMAQRTTTTGQRIQSVRFASGSVADLKEGQTIAFSANGDRFASIQQIPVLARPETEKPKEDAPAEK